jgi:hypothetical protein
MNWAMRSKRSVCREFNIHWDTLRDGAGNWEQIGSGTLADNCDLAACRAGVDADHNGHPDIALIAGRRLATARIPRHKHARGPVTSRTA